MRRTPVARAPAPAYPDRVRSPWALGLLAAGGLALGAATLGSSGCRTPGDPVQVEPVPTPGTPREPAPPATEPIPPVPPEVPAVVRPPQEERLGGDMPRPEQPEPAEQ